MIELRRTGNAISAQHNLMLPTLGEVSHELLVSMEGSSAVHSSLYPGPAPNMTLGRVSFLGQEEN